MYVHMPNFQQDLEMSQFWPPPNVVSDLLWLEKNFPHGKIYAGITQAVLSDPQV